MDWLTQVISSGSAPDDALPQGTLHLPELEGLHAHITAVTGACARTFLVIRHPERGVLTRELVKTRRDDGRLQPLCGAMLNIDGRDFQPLCTQRAEHAARAAAYPLGDPPTAHADCPAAVKALHAVTADTPDPNLRVVTVAGRLLPRHLLPHATLAAELRAHPERVAELTAALNQPATPTVDLLLNNLLLQIATLAVHLLDQRGLFQQPDLHLDHLAEATELRARAAEAQTQLTLQRHYLASLVHDMRAPLTAIMGYAELIQMGIHGHVTEPQRHTLSLILSRTHGALDMVGTILDYARATNRKTRLRLQTFALADLIERAVAAVQLDAQRKHLDLQVQLLADTPNLQIRSSEMRLEQILTNLLSNAVKYTDRGAILLVVDQPNPDTFQIDVTDTGLGIPSSDQERIFLPYHRADASRARAGTGLGLAVSRALVESMGGHLHVHSTLGQGSTFSLLLPVETQPVG